MTLDGTQLDNSVAPATNFNNYLKSVILLQEPNEILMGEVGNVPLPQVVICWFILHVETVVKLRRDDPMVAFRLGVIISTQERCDPL